MPRSTFLDVSVFDEWTHGHDVRIALGVEADRDSAAAAHSLAQLVRITSPRTSDVGVLRPRCHTAHVEPRTTPSTDDLSLHAPDTDDPTQRVHHHARTSHDEVVPPCAIRTLCGMTLAAPRPEAAELPCCAMCAAEMASLGHRCRR